MKKLMHYCLFFIFCCLLLPGLSKAQINTPQPSPAASLKQRVGLTDITIDYSRPSMRGRKIFGDLLPYGQLWRTGANAATKVAFSTEVTIEGNKIPAGEYSLFSIPGQNEWTIIFNKNPKASMADYKEAEDAVRFKVKPQKTTAPVETFTINVGNITNNSAMIELMWENTLVKMKMETDVDSKVMAQIKEKMATAKDEDVDLYFQAALYYMESGKDLNQALEWMNKATAKDPKFWQMYQKARLQAKLKDYKGAEASAQKSIQLAKAAKNDDYVRLNEKLLAELPKSNKASAK